MHQQKERLGICTVRIAGPVKQNEIQYNGDSVILKDERLRKERR